MRFRPLRLESFWSRKSICLLSRGLPLRVPVICCSHDSALRFRTEIMVTGETFVTVETTVGRPTNTDALADLESLGGFAEGDDCAYRFLTGNEWVLGESPFVIKHRE